MLIKRYDKNFKLEVVRQVKELGKKVPELAKELGINENTIYSWIGDFKKNGINAFPGSGKLRPEDDEIHQLKKKNKELEEENAILKKAAAFFAKNLK